MKMVLTETHVLALKDGEVNGYNAVFRTFYEKIVSFSETILDSMQDAEDIAQDTFAKLWKNHQKFESAASVKSWLYTTAKNACFDRLKLRQQRNRQTDNLAQFYSKFEPDNILKAIIHSELFNDINNEIEQLPTTCRDVFKMLYHQEMTPKEVASLLNISEGTVYNHKSNALKKLRKTPFYKSLMLSLYILVYFYLNK